MGRVHDHAPSNKGLVDGEVHVDDQSLHPLWMCGNARTDVDIAVRLRGYGGVTIDGVPIFIVL